MTNSIKTIESMCARLNRISTGGYVLERKGVKLRLNRKGYLPFCDNWYTRAMMYEKLSAYILGYEHARD